MILSQEISEYTKTLDPVRLNAALKLKVFQLSDITRLRETDTEEEMALFFDKLNDLVGLIAGICVYPKFVRFATAEFANQPTRIISVANFPSGDASLESVLIEINNVLQDGATEVDVVLPYQAVLAGESSLIPTFVDACKVACGNKILKIILETAAFSSLEQIFTVSQAVLAAGADFIKSSTGKHEKGGANLDTVAAMLLAIREQRKKSPRHLGIKISGGIKNLDQAGAYLALAERIMGAEWITANTFRFGASQVHFD